MSLTRQTVCFALLGFTYLPPTISAPLNLGGRFWEGTGGYGGFSGVAELEGWGPTIIRREATPYLFTIHYSLFTREGQPLPYNGRPMVALTIRTPSISFEIVGGDRGVWGVARSAVRGGKPPIFVPKGHLTYSLFTIHSSLFTREGQPLPYNGRPMVAPTFTFA